MNLIKLIKTRWEVKGKGRNGGCGLAGDNCNRQSRLSAGFDAGIAHEMDFDASGLPSGLYFVRLEAMSRSGMNSTSRVQKMVLLK